MLLAACAGIAGCAQLKWYKPGMDAAALEQNLAECRQLARARAVRETWPFGLAGPRIIGVDRDGRAIVFEPYPRDTDRFLREHDLTRACMHKKGYALVPVGKADAR